MATYLRVLDPVERTMSDLASGEASHITIRVAQTFLAVLYCTVAFFLPFSVERMSKSMASCIPPW